MPLPGRRARAEGYVPNLAPMVDVIMVILVFFLLGATLRMEGVLATELDPRSGPGPGAAVEILPSVQIALAANADEPPAIYVMSRPLEEQSFAALHAYLGGRIAAGADPQSPVVVAAQSAVRWRYVIAAMDAVVGAGFRNVQFATPLASGNGAAP